MRFLYITAFWLVSGYCYAQPDQDLSWYKQLDGKIDQYPVTLHLHKAGHNYTGYYYYQSQQNPVYFIGEDSSQKGTIQLLLFAGQQQEEILSFTLNRGEAMGIWKKNASSKPLPFKAAENSTGALPFTYVYTTGSAALRPKMKESPKATFEAAAIWPEGSSATAQFIRQVVRQAFDENGGSGEIGGALLNSKKRYLADYVAEYSSVTDKEVKEAPNAYTMDQTSRLLIAFRSPKLLTLAQFNYGYTGGAHGNYATTYLSLDLSAPKKLSLQEVLNVAGIKALEKLLPHYFRKAHGLQPAQSLTDGGLFENKLAPNENFFVTGKGLGFSYAPYEVGPYALGEIEVFIPFAELQAYLQPGFQKLLAP